MPMVERSRVPAVRSQAESVANTSMKGQAGGEPQRQHGAHARLGVQAQHVQPARSLAGGGVHSA